MLGTILAIEAEASRPPASGDALREAANRLLTECYEVIPPPYDAPGDWDERAMEPSLEACRAMASALAATPPERIGLDVERLAEASMLADGSHRIEGRIPVLHQERAMAIAAEYERLGHE